MDKLQYFKAVYEAGSVHGAARMLHIAQPSVTYAIKFLEEALDTRLFHRDRKGVRLTESGLILKRYTEEIFRLADRADEESRQPVDPLSGTLRVGTYDIFAVHLLPLVMAKFKKALPQLRIELVISNSNSRLIQALEQGEVQLAVMAEPRRNSRLLAQTLYTESFAFFASGEVPEAASRNWLEERSLVVFGQAIATPGKTIMQVLERTDLDGCVRHNLSSFDAVLSFARRSLGVALAPHILTERIIAPRDLKRVKIRGVRDADFGAQKIAAVTDKWHASDPKITAFLHALTHQINLAKHQ
jgi:DNA-binding transcriptional LysR family regulator